MSIPGAQPQQPYSQLPTSTAMPAYPYPNPYASPPGPPGPPPAPPSPPSRGVGPRWLWALGGAVLASVTWAASLMATGALDDKDSGPAASGADFQGYRFHHDMCETAKIKSFRTKYELSEPSNDEPDGYSSRQKGLNVSQCSRTLLQRGETSSTPATTYVSTTVKWHKRSDPTGEFASEQHTWEDQSSGSYKYTVAPVRGFGDEAYLVREQRGSTLGSATLAVRAGWLTYEMRWSWFAGGPDEKFKPPTPATVVRMLKTDTRATLAALKKADSKEPPTRDPAA